MKGILFRPWKVTWISQLKEGEHGVTRRLIKPEPSGFAIRVIPVEGGYYEDTPSGRKRIMGRPPLYSVDEVVYVKEGIHRFSLEYATYDLDITPVMFCRSASRFHWRWARAKLSPMFLPNEAARTFIEFLDVRTEKLKLPLPPEELRLEGGEKSLELLTPIDRLWVWRYEFRRVERP